MVTLTEVLKSLWNYSTEENTKWFKNESRGTLQKKEPLEGSPPHTLGLNTDK